MDSTRRHPWDPYLSFLWAITLIITCCLTVSLLNSDGGLQRYLETKIPEKYFGIIKRFNLLQVVGWVATLFFFFMPVWFEYPGDFDTVILSKEGEQIKVHRFGLITPGKKWLRISLTDDLSVKSDVVPITLNPKARRVHFVVQGKIIDPSAYFLARYDYASKPIRVKTEAHPAALRTTRDATIVIDYWLFEFGEANSTEIGTFYNPLEPHQQERFAMLLMDWVNPRLATAGIEIYEATFTIK